MASSGQLSGQARFCGWRGLLWKGLGRHPPGTNGKRLPAGRAIFMRGPPHAAGVLRAAREALQAGRKVRIVPVRRAIVILEELLK